MLHMKSLQDTKVYLQYKIINKKLTQTLHNIW